MRSWSASLYRICRIERDPIHFGRQGLGRFDDPRKAFGVLYVAGSAEGARISFPEPLRLVDLRSRFNPSLQCLALFDRAGAGLSWEDLGPLLEGGNCALVAGMLTRYGFALI